MSNSKYQLWVRQVSYDGGKTYSNLNGVYKVGTVVESPSNCGGERQYRWYQYPINSNKFDCDSSTKTKYQIAVYQYSDDGTNWYDVVPMQFQRSGTTISNSPDCGYKEISAITYDISNLNYTSPVPASQTASTICYTGYTITTYTDGTSDTNSEYKCDTVTYSANTSTSTTQTNNGEICYHSVCKPYSIVQDKKNDGGGEQVIEYRWYVYPIDEKWVCGGDEEDVQYRWYQYPIDSQYYDCDSTTHTKYQVAVLQYSNDGTNWNNVSPLKTQRSGTSISNSTDCGYEPSGDCTILLTLNNGNVIEINNTITTSSDINPYTDTVVNAFLPNCVTSIGDDTFYNCSGLTSVTIGSGVTRIGDDAFLNCTGLPSITIPDSVTSIGSGAFDNCTSLTSITIPNSVTSIGIYAFGSCRSLSSVTIGNGVTSIGDRVFYYCTSLTSITIPNSVTSIGSGAFEWCDSLSSVTIPNSVTRIGDDAFEWCDSLSSVTIPNSVTYIGVNAFENCSGLTSVTIGSGVTSISSNAFSYCGNLSYINYNGTKAQWGNIYKGDLWIYGVLATVIHCTDGNIPIDEA